jgi:DNA-binding Xre family transcriptional regulator
MYTGGLIMFRSRLAILLAEKEHQERRKFSQDQIAKETKLSRATISSWMSSEGMPRLDAKSARALCEFLDCELEDLVELEDCLAGV